VDITDVSAIASAFGAFRPTAVIHLAAESHVDGRSMGRLHF
jgi:dTDP-D-glucose 4,6-dehydratase